MWKGLDKNLYQRISMKMNLKELFDIGQEYEAPYAASIEVEFDNAVLASSAGAGTKNIKVFFTGPEKAGKTTLVNWRLKDEPTHVYSQTGTGRITTFKDEKYQIDLYDMGGGVEYLVNGVFEKKLKESDVAIFVFDVKRYINIDKYRNDEVNPRLSFLWGKKDLFNGKILISVGTHIDEVGMSENELRNHIRNLMNGKEYKSVFYNYPLILTNLTEREGAKTVFNTLDYELQKTNKP